MSGYGNFGNRGGFPGAGGNFGGAFGGYGAAATIGGQFGGPTPAYGASFGNYANASTGYGTNMGPTAFGAAGATQFPGNLGGHNAYAGFGNGGSIGYGSGAGIGAYAGGGINVGSAGFKSNNTGGGSGGGTISADRQQRSVFVGNIPYKATENELIQIFSKAGNVVAFRLVSDRDTGRPKGFGFCEYSDAASASTAMETLNGIELHGRPLRVGSSK